MIEFLKWVFGMRPTVWLVQAEYSKYGRKYPRSPKSQGHKGDKINNSFCNMLFYQYEAPNFDEIEARIKTVLYAKASNIKVIDIKRLS